jgi:hypothetical protein
MILGTLLEVFEVKQQQCLAGEAKQQQQQQQLSLRSVLRCFSVPANARSVLSTESEASSFLGCLSGMR